MRIEGSEVGVSRTRHHVAKVEVANVSRPPRGLKSREVMMLDLLVPEMVAERSAARSSALSHWHFPLNRLFTALLRREGAGLSPFRHGKSPAEPRASFEKTVVLEPRNRLERVRVFLERFALLSRMAAIKRAWTAVKSGHSKSPTIGVKRNRARLHKNVTSTMKWIGGALLTLAACLAADLAEGQAKKGGQAEGGAIPVTIKDCAAPATAIRIQSPSCVQLWATHLFRRLGPAHFEQWSASIDQFERGALTAERWIERVTSIGGLLVDVFGGPNDALKAAEILYDANGTVLTLIPIEDPVYEIGVEAVNTVRNGIKTAIVYSVRGTASPPYAEMVSLANRVGALWNTQRIIRERHTLILVREYLRQLYMFGGDQGVLADSRGLPRQASRQDILASVNKEFGFVANPLSSNSYSPAKTEQAIIAWTGAIAGLAAKQTAATATSAAGRATPSTVGGGSQSRSGERTSTELPSPASQTSPALGGSSQGLSGAEFATALGATTEQSRLYAITQMVRQGAIRNPLAAEEVALIVKGTTGGNRAQAIAELAQLIKPKLTASEGAAILGAQKDLDEQSRLYAIQALTRRNRLGDLGSDAMLLLTGTTGGNRAQAIAEMAGSFKTALSAQEVADTLGDPKQLNEQSRLYAIQALARANKLAVWAADAAGPLAGTTHGNRAQAIAEMTKSLKTGLTAQEVAQLLGDPKELNEQNRLYAIQALARAKKLAAWAADAATPLSGTTGGNRAQAIAEIAASLRAGLSGAEGAAILGGAEALSEQSRLYAVQALARAKKLKYPLSGEELGLLLLGTSGENRAQGLAELTRQR